MTALGSLVKIPKVGFTAFFTTSTPSYADEQLTSHLSSLSTIPIHLPTSTQSLSGPDKPSPHLESALSELSGSIPPNGDKLKEVLQSLVDKQQGEIGGYVVESEMDKLVESEILGRAVTVAWKVILDELMTVALALERERAWWDSVLNSRRGVGIYLLQTLPHRIYDALPPHSSLNFRTFTQLPTSALFPRSPSAAISTLVSPYSLTRREVLSSRKELLHTRDAVAKRIGLLASDGPNWNGDAVQGDLNGETARLYAVLCHILEVPPPQTTASTSKRSRSATITPSAASSGSTPTPASLLTILTTHLPRSRAHIDKVLTAHKRSGPLTRLWFPLLFLPPALYTGVSLIVRNKDWMKEQVRNAKETIRGFIVQWVWEPLEGIGKTMRGGGEGLGVAPTTVKSDQESLERMVLDLGKDYYHMSPDQLQNLSVKIRAGDMEEVLRVYEKEMQSPVKNALLGSLIRTLLIQVQKTKTDLSLSLLSLDHLLRSQQLTFAFVGVAPSVLVLYGVGGWLRGVYRGEKRGKGRRKAYFSGVRDIERLLLTAPKKDEQMSDRDRGLLIVGVSSMRSWAAGLSGGNREGFLDDLRLVEDPALSRGDKLRVVERIWRCWGTDGRRKV